MVKNEIRALIVAVVILLAFIGFGAFKYRALGQVNTELKTKVEETEKRLADVEFEKTSLSEVLAIEQAKNKEFEDQIRDLTKQVGGLVKLSKIDEELLQKYSKVFFLSENYAPQRLVDVDEEFILPEGREVEFHSQAWPFLRALLNAAKNDDLKLRVTSGFRSFDTQADLKTNYKVTYGAGTANQFSADQGYSEHQLGTAVDFTTPTTDSSLNGFDKTPEYAWLLKNAHRYGFVLSYPPNNSYYLFEPWHWRFVGEDLAEKLYREKKYFFELDQRDIDKYLVKLFDK